MNRTLFRYPTVADVRKSDADVTLALAPTQQQKAFRVFHELNSTSIAATVSGVDVCLDIKAYSTTAGSAVNAWPCGQRGVKDNEFCKVLFHRHLVRLMPLTTRFVRRHAIPPAFSSSDGPPLTAVARGAVQVVQVPQPRQRQRLSFGGGWSHSAVPRTRTVPSNLC